MDVTNNQLNRDNALSGLLEYCKDNKITIDTAIHAHRDLNLGLGIYAAKLFRKKAILIHVPTKSLLTAQSIPESFLPKSSRDNLTVHAQLTLFLTFGCITDIAAYGRWIATWPEWEVFRDGLPMFWFNDFRDSTSQRSVAKVQAGHTTKRKRAGVVTRTSISQLDSNLTSSTYKARNFTISPAIEGRWITLEDPLMEGSIPADDENMLKNQVRKLQDCIRNIPRQIAGFDISLEENHDQYLKYLWMWSCVNTRCFYYVPPRHKAPDDPNEAMALCAFQDLFNHTSSKARKCSVSYDKDGFHVKASRDVQQGEEVLVSYGKHNNDFLWVEYGFILEKNVDDFLVIDQIVLHGLSSEQTTILENGNYLGDYMMRIDGVCWRTEMVAWLYVLEDEQDWMMMTEGHFDPEQQENYTELKRKVKRKILDWMVLIRKEVDHNLTVIFGLEQDANILIESFVNNASLERRLHDSKEEKLEIARKRRDMCVMRWKQIYEMCCGTARAIEEECPEAMITCGEDDESLFSKSSSEYLGHIKKRAVRPPYSTI